MDSAGSFVPVVGAPLIVRVSSGARWVTIRNDSPNQLHITCGPMPPTSPSQANSYHMTIEAWSGDNYDTWAEAMPGSFDGVVYLLATLPVGLAAAGTVSGRNLVSLDTYTARETPPTPYSGIPRQQDATNQTRTIFIPISPTYSYSGDHAWAGNDIFNPFPTLLVLSPSAGTLPFAANVHVYLYGYLFTCITAPSGALIFQLNIEEVDASLGTVVATHLLSEFGFASATDIAPRPFFPAIPKQLTFQPLNTCRGLRLALFDQTPAVSVRMTYEVLVDVDVFNTGNNSWVTAIGGGATGTPVASTYGSGGELF